ncbi:hypothetical protein F2Q70_00024029 [Brassica cretica]|uniref:Peroxisome biogenesis protein 12 n=1 Tax=Brassica cretica TaxID=69181 RepID=A0A8S9GH47_BRACR|nr:hypothetical protein F2Q70_00024029 [Brassica cretica]
MAAAQQLPSSLRAALTYSLGVFALRRSFLHRILDYEDEFFASLMLVLEGHSLRTTEASFAESLYGLRRKSVRLRLSQHSGLEKRHRILSVVFLVVLPYFKSKLHAIYNKEREARLRESLWGAEEQGFDEDYLFSGEEPVVSRGDSGNQELSVRVKLATRIKKVIAVCYPWMHASSDGLSFTYQLLYLLDATGFYSLGLQALGVQVCRATGQELMDTSSRISKIRNHERERLCGPPWLKTVQGALLSCSYAVLDYTQTGLIAAVFIFKVTEERLTAPTVYPPPPPPPSPKVAKEGIPLPPDRTLCALCLQKRANPSVVTVSGFVFCYSCVFKYVTKVSSPISLSLFIITTPRYKSLCWSCAVQYKRCPVTLIPTSVDQIRRLFHDT